MSRQMEWDGAGRIFGIPVAYYEQKVGPTQKFNGVASEFVAPDAQDPGQPTVSSIPETSSRLERLRRTRIIYVMFVPSA